MSYYDAIPPYSCVYPHGVSYPWRNQLNRFCQIVGVSRPEVLRALRRRGVPHDPWDHKNRLVALLVEDERQTRAAAEIPA